MDEKLMQVECDPDCGFLIRSHNEKEVIEDAAKHSKMMHNKTVNNEEVKTWIKEAS